LGQPRSNLKSQLIAIVAAMLLVGCGTPQWQKDRTKRWDQRVESGTFTYNDAIKANGPFTEETALDDGTKVCVWRTSKFVALPNGFATTLHDRFQVVFNKDNVLTKWSWRRN
tara:strand:- start:60 stop:395 length:336 start_codon:yes stop_codon:yes gene_type:complete